MSLRRQLVKYVYRLHYRIIITIIYQIVAQRNTRRKKGAKRSSFSRIGGTNNHQTSTPLPETENLDKLERLSLSSMAIDSFKWLHKTEARTDNYMKFSRNMWHDAPRRGSKQWFLGQESKVEKETVPKRKRREIDCK